MRRVLVFISLILIGWGLAFASEDQADSGDYGFGNSFAEFVDTHKNSIVDPSNAILLDDSQILGLAITDASRDDWRKLAQRLTNVVCLRIQTSKADLSESLFAALTNFTRLEYLHLQCRNAVAITDRISLLTNLVHLRYLGIIAPSATNIDRSIYQNTQLKELCLSVGAIRLPNGIARLRELEYLQIFGKKLTPIRDLPTDFSQLLIHRLAFGGVTSLEKMLPSLPEQLVRLAANNCQMASIPPAWFNAPKLEIVNLSGNQLVQFPMGLLSLPSVRIIDLGLNNITNVPPIEVSADRTVKVNLVGNPIQHFASEDKPLVERGVVIK